MLLCMGTIAGGEHLWYVPCCLFCYLLTPLIVRKFDFLFTLKNKKKFLVYSLISLIVLCFIINRGAINNNLALFFCYIIGIYMGKLKQKNKKRIYIGISIGICIIATICNSIQIIQNYIFKIELQGYILNLYKAFCNYAHVLLGIMLFLIMKKSIDYILKKDYPKFIKIICKKCDKYSYSVYLVHQFFILGPGSLMRLTSSLAINIIIILTLIIITSGIVYRLSSLIRDIINKKCINIF